MTGPRDQRSHALAAILLLWGLCEVTQLFVSPARPSSSRTRVRVGRAAGQCADCTCAEEPGPCAEPKTSYRLLYFDGRGAAETARMLFAVAGEEYEDKRYSISFGTPGDFSTLQREEFLADQKAGKMAVGMDKVPILEVGDLQLPQSKAIERYLASKFGLMGDSPEQAAWVDAVCEHVRDVAAAYASTAGPGFKKDPEKEQKWFDEVMPGWLTKLDTSLPGSDGFAVGTKTSLADVVIFRLLKDTYSRDVSATYADCPKLNAIVAKMEANEAVKKWMSERPQTMF